MHKQTLCNKVLKIAIATTLATAMSWMYVSPALAKSSSSTQKPTTVSAKRKPVTSKSTTTIAKHTYVASKSTTSVEKHTRQKSKLAEPVTKKAFSNQQAIAAMDAQPIPVISGTNNASATLTVATAANATPILITTKDTPAKHNENTVSTSTKNAAVKPVTAVINNTDATPTTKLTTFGDIGSALEAAFTSSKTSNPTPVTMPAATPAKSQFVQQMLNNTNAVNTEILRERARMLSLQASFDEGKSLSDSDQAWLTDLANRYHVANPNLQSPQTWTQLTQKVDVIPASLVLGQSIQESGWGASSIAKRAHNYFGQKCVSSGCFPGTRYQSFTSMRAAVTAYIHNLNSNGAYQALRALRFQARSANEVPNSVVLASGLNAYSTLRGNYISSIKNVITSLKLQRYDAEVA